MHERENVAVRVKELESAEILMTTKNGTDSVTILSRHSEKMLRRSREIAIPEQSTLFSCCGKISVQHVRLYGRGMMLL